MLTIDLSNVSTTLHSDSDVNASKSLLPKQQHWLQKLEMTQTGKLYLYKQMFGGLITFFYYYLTIEFRKCNI